MSDVPSGQDAPSHTKDVDWKKLTAADGWLAPVIVVLLCFIIVELLWTPLSWPSRFVNGIVKGLFDIVASSDCGGIDRSRTAAISWCAIGVALLTLLGPLVVMVTLFVFRRTISKQLKRGSGRIPAFARYPVAPLIATVVFTIGWAGVHYNTAFLPGILRISNKAFPVVLGIFTFATVQYGGWLHRRMVPFLVARDKIKFWIRLVVTFLIPLVIGILLTRGGVAGTQGIQDPTVKEQAIVLIAIIAGWMLLAPRMDKKGAKALTDAIEEMEDRYQARRHAKEGSRT